MGGISSLHREIVLQEMQTGSHDSLSDLGGTTLSSVLKTYEPRIFQDKFLQRHHRSVVRPFS